MTMTPIHADTGSVWIQIDPYVVASLTMAGVVVKMPLKADGSDSVSAHSRQYSEPQMFHFIEIKFILTKR